MPTIHRPSRRGFTLIELLITAGILAAVATLTGVLAAAGLRTWSQNRSQAEAQEIARTALARVSRMIREASSSDNGSYSIAAASAQSFTFYADVDNNGTHDQVRIFLQGTQLKVGMTPPSGVPATYPAGNEQVSLLANFVQNGASPVFSYYDEQFTGTEAALAEPVNLPSIRLVHIAVIVDTDTTKPPTAITLETNAALRNLKDNL